jgi:hypothetical protein
MLEIEIEILLIDSTIQLTKPLDCPFTSPYTCHKSTVNISMDDCDS